jgi:plastocyanin
MAAAGILAVAILASPTGAARRARPTAVGVGEREFRLSVYRSTVPPGIVRFNVTNFGEDVHDLVVVGPSGARVAASGEIRAGRRLALTARLARPGTYRLLCTKLDHAARGMRSRLRVVRP